MTQGAQYLSVGFGQYILPLIKEIVKKAVCCYDESHLYLSSIPEEFGNGHHAGNCYL